MNGLLIFVLLLALYGAIAVALARRGRKVGQFELTGPFIMWRTQWGKRTIDRLAKSFPRFWERWADVAIWTTWFAGLLIFALLVYQIYLLFTMPVLVAENAPPPQYLLGLPGVNPIIPVGYGIFGLLVALIVHEGSHGVLARVGRMSVKSLGLLFFIVPIGAFVEPDEKDLEKATAREKNRVFAAGPMANIALAIVSAILFSALLMGSVSVTNDGEGIGITGLVDDGPAAAAGFAEGDILVSLDGHVLDSQATFNRVLNDTRAGQRVTVAYLRDDVRQVTTVTLADKLAFLDPAAPAEAKADARGKGFLGVRSVDLGVVATITDILHRPLGDGPLKSFNPSQGGSFIFYAFYPFFVLVAGLDILAAPLSAFIQIGGVWAALPAPVFFVTANSLYWLFWLNLMLGTFNALPAGPLDGGQMLRATARERFIRIHGVDESRLKLEEEEGVPGARLTAADEETAGRMALVDRDVRRVTWSVGFLILGLILLLIIGPRLVRVFQAVAG